MGKRNDGSSLAASLIASKIFVGIRSCRYVPLIVALAGYFALAYYHYSPNTTTTSSMEGFSFEVFGRVQGVYFRKYTQLKAAELHVGGWIRNHKGRGTVQGQVICAKEQQCQQMQGWLAHVGSPMSTIEKAIFTPMEDSAVRELQQELQSSNTEGLVFEVRKSKK